MNRLLRAAAAAVVAALLTGCGVTTQDEPHAVELPRRPLTAGATGDITPGPAGEIAEVLCLVRDGRLIEVVRRVEASPTPQQQLDHLTAGPTRAERNGRLTTALTGLTLSVSFPSAGVADVEVAEDGESTARRDETVAYGQIVCTLTSRPDVSSVVFTRSGERLEVPRADGSLSRGPLFAADFATLVGER